MKGKIVLIPFPYTDLTGSKPRPALVLAEAPEDVVVAFISSRVSHLTDSCLLIDESYPDYEATGLKTASVLRLDKVATIARSLLIGEIGEVTGSIKADVNKKLAKIFRL